MGVKPLSQSDKARSLQKYYLLSRTALKKSLSQREADYSEEKTSIQAVNYIFTLGKMSHGLCTGCT